MTTSTSVRAFLDGIGGMSRSAFVFGWLFSANCRSTLVHDQVDADARVPMLAVLGGSYCCRVAWAELSGPLDLTPWLSRLDWVILSGSSTGPTDLEWLRRVIADCRAAKVPVWVRSIGKRPRDPVKGPEFGLPVGLVAKGYWWSIKLRDPTGSDPSEWPTDLNVREVPDWLKGA